MDLRNLISAESPTDRAGNQNSDPADRAQSEQMSANSSLICSAKACRAEATWAIRWNNPKLHSPERRKVWLACDEHEVTLRDFLGVRGFYIDSVRPADLSSSDG